VEFLIEELCGTLGDKKLLDVLAQLKSRDKSNTAVIVGDGAATPLISAVVASPFLYVVPSGESVAGTATCLTNSGLRVLSANCPDMPIYTNTPNVKNAEFFSAVSKFAGGGYDALVLPATALTTRVPVVAKTDFVVSVGAKIGVGFFANAITNFGYMRVGSVSAVGEFSVRGDVVDIWSEGEVNPTRVFFFGDVVEAVKQFDPASFLSINTLQKQSISPLTQLGSVSNELIVKKLSTAAFKNVATVVNPIIARATRGENLGAVTWLLPLFTEFQDILSAISGVTKTVVFDRPREAQQNMELAIGQNKARLADLIVGGLLTPKHEVMFASSLPSMELEKFVCVGFQGLNSNHALFKSKRVLEANTRLVPNYLGNLGAMTGDLVNVTKQGKTAVVFVGQSPALGNYLSDKGIAFCTTKDIASIKKNKINLIAQELGASFEMPDCNAVIFSMNRESCSERVNIFETVKSAFVMPAVGEVVVHENHGLGRYMGMKKLSLQDAERDYIVLQYDGGALVYLPPEQTGLLSNYNGEPARLSKLGGQDFANAKQRVRRQLKELSFKLSELYGRRARTVANIYDYDANDVAQFYATCPYQLTPDQQRAVDDIERDMQSTKVMDRLICGDVGYGKTEVALHAAFRAIMSGYQVVLLCPTTVLSVQHYNTAIGRLSCFGIRVEVLNRFKSDKEVAEILRGLYSGEVDMVVGTHKLLSLKQDAYKNLGLLILDEEQRFGVGHKETIKQIKTNIDVITMSATPIPRTLNMALVGIRDISMISTAPVGRFPVITYVTEYSNALLMDAIARELGRGGQVIILYNDVATIRSFASKLSRQLNGSGGGEARPASTLTPPEFLQPNTMRLGEEVGAHEKPLTLGRVGLSKSQEGRACGGRETSLGEYMATSLARIKVGVVHGQMPTDMLEDTIVDMYQGKINVMVASTIIENGIDISNANTLVVIDADRLGVAQMHQLRGRVGRGGTQAYAYFTYGNIGKLSDISAKRLEAIASHFQSGAGLQIAMKDLQLRGAGSILGAHQSGHMEQIGFDTYCKILSEVASENSGGEVESDRDLGAREVVLNIALSSFIPETYIPSEDERMKVYMTVSKIRSEEERDRVLEHLGDLYGKPPVEVLNIVTVGYIRMLSNKLDIKHISLTREDCRVTFADGIDQHEMMKVVPLGLCVLVQGVNLVARVKIPTVSGLINFLEKM
jgi:transcription-repair coupling factor (superfamily II helicase)